MNAAKINGNSPAHPWGEHGARLGGLTKREEIAKEAMKGILGNAYWNEHGDYTPEDVAKSARGYADALLAELAKGGES